LFYWPPPTEVLQERPFPEVELLVFLEIFLRLDAVTVTQFTSSRRNSKPNEQKV